MATSLKPITKKEAAKIKVGDMVAITWSDARPCNALVTDIDNDRCRGPFSMKGMVYDHGSDAYHVTHFQSSQVVQNTGRMDMIGLDDVLIDGWWHSATSEEAKAFLKGQ